MNCQVRPLDVKFRWPPTVPFGRQCPGWPSPASTGVHRPPPDRTSIPVTVTDPDIVAGPLMDSPVAGPEMVRSAITHGQPVSGWTDERGPPIVPKYSGVWPPAAAPSS